MAKGGKRPGAGRKPSANQRQLKETRERTNQNLIPFVPGQSGNPKGRPTAGATLREWMNQLAAQGLTEAQLRKVARDKDAPWPKRAAAERVLRTLEAGDIADMQAWLDGETDLQGLRKIGVNTEVIKKAKIKRKIVYVDKSSGETTEVEEREIELHDRAGADFDRVADRTEGKPTQRVELDGTLQHVPEAVVLVHTAPPAQKGA